MLDHSLWVFVHLINIEDSSCHLICLPTHVLLLPSSVLSRRDSSTINLTLGTPCHLYPPTRRVYSRLAHGLELLDRPLTYPVLSSLIFVQTSLILPSTQTEISFTKPSEISRVHSPLDQAECEPSSYPTCHWKSRQKTSLLTSLSPICTPKRKEKVQKGYITKRLILIIRRNVSFPTLNVRRGELSVRSLSPEPMTVTRYSCYVVVVISNASY